MLSKSNRRKQFLFFFFLVSLKYREIVTVKTVTLYKKLYFFIKSLESKKKKLALTSFQYVNQETWLGNSKKAYLHRPIKILQFPIPARIQKCLT